MSATLAPPPAPPNGTGAIGTVTPPASPARAMALDMMPKPPPVEPVDDHPNAEHRDQLARWVKMANIADDEDISDQLEEIAARVTSDHEIDDNSRLDWKEKYR